MDQRVNGLVRRYTWKLESQMNQEPSDTPQKELEAALKANQKCRDDIQKLYLKFQPAP